MAVPRNARVNSTVPALPKTSQLRRALIGSVASLVASAQSSPTLAQGAYGGTPAPPLSDGEPIQLPTLAVEGAQKSTEGGYKADQSSLGKLTEPLVNTPADFARIIAADTELWRDLVRELGIKAE